MTVMYSRAALGLLASLLVLFGVNASTATADDRPGREPGLPFIDCIGFPSVPCAGDDDTSVDDYGWLNLAQVGMTGSIPAKQWAPIPLSMMATATEFGFDYYDGPWDSNQTIDLRIRAFFTSPKGSSSNYGESPLIPVHTVAFGSVPAEITLQVVQQRKPNGDPVPLRFTDRSRAINFPQDRPDLEAIFTLEEALEPLEATVEVRVVKFKLDGVETDLGKGCTTGPRAKLSLTTHPKTIEVKLGQGSGDPRSEQTSPDEVFNGAAGGSLFGTIDIPPFLPCNTPTAGNMGPIFTSAISGPGNPVHVKTGIVSCVISGDDGRFDPNPPGVTSPYDPRSKCDTSLVAGNYKAVPSPLPIPDYAPGEQPTP